jgi:hypothetical protein
MLAFNISAPAQDRADGGKGDAGLKGLHPLNIQSRLRAGALKEECKLWLIRPLT